MQSRPDQIIVLSLDYDGCGQDLFTNGIEATEFLSGLHKLIANASRFSNIEVHVYVGSARQDIATDKEANRLNRNGFCFENYPKLCAEQGWIFQPLLLADKQNNLPSGTAIKNEKYSVISLDPNKIEILEIQLDDITSRFPNTPIEFIFIDDDKHGHQILDENARHFQFTVPNNVSLRLVQYELDTIKLLTNSLFVEKFHINAELNFDPIKASHYESIILNQLLVSCVKNGNEIFYPGVTYLGELNITAKQPLRREFKLTDNFGALYFRPRATTSYGYRFEIVGDQQLGHGQFGAIFNSITTLVPQSDGSLTRKSDAHPDCSPRVHKLATGKYPEDAERLKNRNNNNKHARHLRVKQLTLNESTALQPKSFTAMQNIPGKHLWTVLSESMLNTQQSISLALSILYAYRDQLHAYQLVHGDIKPDNVLIAYSNPITAHFVDFDFCQLASSNNRNPTGAPGYHPPEFRDKKYMNGSTPASDRYALGLTIGEIFFAAIEDYAKLAVILDFNKSKPFDISEDEKSRVIQCITLLTSADPAMRCSIDTAIEIFEQLELNRLPESAEIQSHYEQAAAFSKTMREAFAGKPASSENIIAFLGQFIQEMSQQTYNEYSPHLSADSREFIAKVAGLSAFPTHTKQALIQLASQLLLTHEQLERNIKSSMDRLMYIPASLDNDVANTALHIRQLLDHVTQKQKARADKYPLSLQNIHLICTKCKKENNQLDYYREACKRGLFLGHIYLSSHPQHFFKPMIIVKNPDPKPTCVQETTAQASLAAQPSGLLSAVTCNIERGNPAANAADADTYHVVRP